MRFLLLFALLLLPSLAQAQSTAEKCLINETEDNRVSGTVEYVSYKHPSRDITINGYKLTFLRPRCYEFISLESGKPVRGYIKEIAIQNWRDYESILKSRTGKTVAATGGIEDNRTVYYITSPQIYAGSVIACEVSPKTKAAEKC